jgi:2-oxoisovalerate dehydrogenase E1 component
VHRAGNRATIVTWGEMVHRCAEAVESIGADVEIIDLRTIVPWDRDMVLESVRRTNRCMVVHEDTITCGFGAEVASTVTQELFASLDAPVVRLATPMVPIPYNKGMMNAVIPSVVEIGRQVEQMISF